LFCDGSKGRKGGLLPLVLVPQGVVRVAVGAQGPGTKQEKPPTGREKKCQFPPFRANPQMTPVMVIVYTDHLEERLNKDVPLLLKTQ
jgi:hypothetical protein